MVIFYSYIHKRLPEASSDEKKLSGSHSDLFCMDPALGIT